MSACHGHADDRSGRASLASASGVETLASLRGKQASACVPLVRSPVVHGERLQSPAGGDCIRTIAGVGSRAGGSIGRPQPASLAWSRGARKQENQGDVDVADAVISPDLVEHRNFGLSYAPGVEGVKAVIASLRRAFSDFHLVIDLALAGDRLRMTGTATNDGSVMGHERTGRLMRTDVVDALRFEDGRIGEHWGVPDRLGTLFELGLAQPPGAR
jgi:ketosteroid isomerase-like protein